MQYETAKELYEEIKERAAHSPISGFQNFYTLFLGCAADYAATRTSWACMDQSQRNENDKSRRAKHDAFISILSAISRSLGIDNMEEMMPDRKTKGDFACYIALFLGLEQR